MQITTTFIAINNHPTILNKEVTLLSGEETRKPVTPDKEDELDFGFEEDEETLILYEKPKWYREYLSYIIFGTIILTVLVTRMFFYTVVITWGESMMPTMEHLELALINKIDDPSTYERGDIIIFKGERTYVKRIVGLSGDIVSIANNKVYINGEELEELYLDMDMHYVMSDLEETLVPENSFFVLGDNRGNSMDSRNGLGMPTYDSILGKVITHAHFPFKFN